MILQTDLVIAVRVITTARPGETLDDVLARMQETAEVRHSRLTSDIELNTRVDTVDHSAGGVSVTTTVVQE